MVAMNAYRLLLVGVFIGLVLADDGKVKTAARAEVESCGGWQLNKMPEVKAFIYQDVPEYENVKFTHVGGKKPDISFYDENDEKIETIELQKKTREECNNILAEYGFERKTEEEEETTAQHDEM